MINFNDRQTITEEDLIFFKNKINECCIDNNFEDKFTYLIKDDVIHISSCVARGDGYAKYTVCYFIKYNNAFHDYSRASNTVYDNELFFQNNCTVFINSIKRGVENA